MKNNQFIDINSRLAIKEMTSMKTTAEYVIIARRVKWRKKMIGKGLQNVCVMYRFKSQQGFFPCLNKSQFKLSEMMCIE